MPDAMQEVYDVAGKVSKSLREMADSLRECDQKEFAAWAEVLANDLQKAIFEAAGQTQHDISQFLLSSQQIRVLAESRENLQRVTETLKKRNDDD